MPFHRAMATRRPLLLAAVLCALTACRPAPESNDPVELMQRGWRAFRLADYRDALAHFEHTITLPALPTAWRSKALHAQAVVWDLRHPAASQDNERAARLYRQVIDENPASDEAAWSLLALARMQHLPPVNETPDPDTIHAAYQAVINRFPDHLAGHEALIHQQAARIATLDPATTRAALDRLTTFLTDHPNAPFASAAWSLTASAHETLGNPAPQLEALLNEVATVEIDPASPASTDLAGRYWQIAVTAEFRVGRFDTARDFYRKLIAEYPLDFRVFPSRQAIARMDQLEASLRGGTSP
jgi:tetratricopeptide (TPR) repeat protein